MGGFMAVCVTDFIQGMLMVVALVTVPVVAYALMGGDVAGSLAQTGVNAANFLNVMKNGDNNFTAVEIISQLAWGLGYCGMPHILVRFMAVKNQKELNKSKSIAIIWVIISLAMAVVIGVIGRAYLYPTVLGADGGSTETVFIEMITRIFTQDLYLPVVAGLFLCGILAAIMSTADSQLLVTASSMSEEIYKGIINRKASEEKVMKVSRYTVLGVAVLAYLIAWDPNSSIMGLVSNAWAGLGAAFGPTVLMSLFWKRCNLQGAVAGIVSGGLTVIIWDYIPLVAGQTLGTVTGLYSLAIGFLISIVLIVIVSLCTKAPDASIVAEFERVASDEEI
jgi:sodium/proline symporter